jgi:hypothetical protein
VPDHIDYLVHWLATIGTESLQYLKLLSIEFVIHHTHITEEPLSYSGDFRTWHEFVACLSALDLRPSQLRWTWARRTKKAGRRGNWFSRAPNAYFFAEYTLQPLLKDHNLLDKSNFTINVLLDLEKAENMDESNFNGDFNARDAIDLIKRLETKFVESSHSPRIAYRNHVSEIINEGPGVLGRFYDLKYLVNEAGGRKYKHTDGFQDALQSAINLHRDRHRRKREWTRESNVLGTRSLYDYTEFEMQPRNFLHHQVSNARRSTSPVRQMLPKNNATGHTLFEPDATKANDMAISKFGMTSSMAPVGPNRSTLGTADAKQPFRTVARDSKSPFANLPASLATNGTRFTAGFSTKPARTSSPVPNRLVWEYMLDEAGKRVLRRKFPTE